MSALNLFQYEGQQVRTVIINGEVWFVLNDLCVILGLSNPTVVAQRIDEAALSQTEVSSGGQMRSMNIVNEAGMYEVVIRSDKPHAVAFRRWLTSEVLPAIRKTGSYSTPGAPLELDVRNLDHLSLMLDAGKAALNRAVVAEAKVAELEAPAQAWDVMVSAHGDYAVDEAAKILSRDPEIEIGRNRLFTLMQEIGWTYRQGARRNWHAYQSQVENGRIVLRMTAAFLNAKTGEMENPAPTIRVTAKGLEALRSNLKAAMAA